MDAGSLNRYITIQAKTVTINSNGFQIESWIDLLSSVPVKKITTGGREYFAAQRQNAETTAVYIARYNKAIKSSMRIKDGNQIYEIIAPPNNVDGKGIEMQLIAKEIT